jgi:hypothetical protein
VPEAGLEAGNFSGYKAYGLEIVAINPYNRRIQLDGPWRQKATREVDPRLLSAKRPDKLEPCTLNIVNCLDRWVTLRSHATEKTTVSAGSNLLISDVG